MGAGNIYIYIYVYIYTYIYIYVPLPTNEFVKWFMFMSSFVGPFCGPTPAKTTLNRLFIAMLVLLIRCSVNSFVGLNK